MDPKGPISNGLTIAARVGYTPPLLERIMKGNIQQWLKNQQLRFQQSTDLRMDGPLVRGGSLPAIKFTINTG